MNLYSTRRMSDAAIVGARNGLVFGLATGGSATTPPRSLRVTGVGMPS